MSYGFIYDSKQLEEREQGTEFGKKTDLIIPAVFFSAVVLLILVRVLIFSNVSLSGVLHTTSQGNIVGEEVAETQIGFDSATDYRQENVWKVVKVKDTSDEGVIIINFPEETAVSNVTVSNYYTDRAFNVSVEGISKSALSDISVAADTSVVSSAAVRYSDDSLQISVTMNGIYEYDTEVKEGGIAVYYSEPSSIYKAVIVIDPIKNNGDDITALVAEEVEAVAAETGMGVYITRETDGNRTKAERLALMVDADPDLIIQLGVSKSNDSNAYGLDAYYNGKFYLPDMSNASIAETLLRNTAIETSNRALTITEAGEDNLLMLVETPAAGLDIGYASNEAEMKLLENPEYRKKIAEGIVKAIQEILGLQQ